MKIKKSILNCVILSALTVNVANADLIIGDSVISKTKSISQSNTPTQTESVKNVSGKYNYVKNIGNPINSVAVKGMGDNLPLLTVLQQIIPQGWKVEKAGDLNSNQFVSWKGGEQWYKILTRVAEDANLLIDINWDQNIIVIMNNTYPQSAMVKTNNVKGNKKTSTKEITKKVETTNLFEQPKYQPTVNSSQLQTWELKSDKTLKENIEEWAKKIGWVLSWDAPDYRIVNNVTLYGALDDPNGPIGRVVNSYKDAKQPLKAKINRGNKVIRIESRNYEQESVVQKTAQELYNTSLNQ